MDLEIRSRLKLCMTQNFLIVELAYTIGRRSGPSSAYFGCQLVHLSRLINSNGIKCEYHERIEKGEM